MKKVLIAIACLVAGTLAFAAENPSKLSEAPIMRPVTWAGEKLEGPVRYTGEVLDARVGQPIREIFPNEDRFDESREIRFRRGNAPNHR
jgi:hypothetical protein